MNIETNVNELLRRLIGKVSTAWGNSNRSQKIYLFSITIFIAALYIYPKGQVQQGGIFLAMLGFLAGFLPTLITCLRKLWQYPAGKLTVIAINAAIFYIAQIVAKQILAESLGLPPYDFSGTLVWLTFVNVVLIWILISMALISLPLFYLIVRICFQKHGLFNLETFGHYMGTIILIAILNVSVFIISGTFLNSSLIKFSAYHLDYFDGHRLIKIEPLEKIMMHANKIISVAKKGVNGEIEIRVLRMENADQESPLKP